jgi:hypothetical protein
VLTRAGFRWNIYSKTGLCDGGCGGEHPGFFALRHQSALVCGYNLLSFVENIDLAS